MPIYEYICTTKSCVDSKDDKVIALLVSMDEKPTCTECGTQLKRILSACKGRVTGSINPVKQ